MVLNELNAILKKRFETTIEDATNEEIYTALMEYTKEKIADVSANTGPRKLYYISAEFLIGKLLANNLINLNLYEEVKAVLLKHGKDLSEIEELEPEPSLGNGGLGRLAACFLDSIATLGLNGDGIGLNYHLGLFRQVFQEHKQQEEPNPWITDDGWLIETATRFQVPFGGFTLNSKLYEIEVTGYQSGKNKLRLFDIDLADETIVRDGITFEKGDILHNLTLFLYPDDGDEKGQLLRVYQQYFMVSNAAQLILQELKENGHSLRELAQYAVIQINDTHPSLVIPELIRLLTNEGIPMDEAIALVSQTCAYTNHTILAEALEKWPVSYLEHVVPHLMPIIRELDRRVKAKYQDEAVALIDSQDRVHMAHMDIHYGFSVNGVAALHTEILKETELKPFYDIYPEKFTNKTNGITFRRWLMHCNQELDHFLTGLIGDGYKKDADQLKELARYAEDQTVLDALRKIKHNNKKKLKKYLLETQGISIDENSVFDIQIKRLHEYKRQQMNALYIIHKYLEIKRGKIPAAPVTMIFGAKAAPAYVIAKDIIHLILCLQELIVSDEEVKKHLNVVMVENYNVTKASVLIPACDISEQISLASKEASGTGNMKFMLNGALTLGTMDGANVEISELVGEDNIYIFGASSDEVIQHYKKADYSALDLYEKDPVIKEAVDFIVGKEMMKIGDSECLSRLYQEIKGKDWFMALLDFKAYVAKKDEAIHDYQDDQQWSRKMLINISQAGYFSADRTIREYNRDIWKLS